MGDRLKAGAAAAYDGLKDSHDDWAAEQDRDVAQLPEREHLMPIMREVRMIGGAVVLIAIVTLVVNEVLTVDSIANSNGPFSGVIDSLNSTGVAAMTLLVVGLIVVAARAIMGYMGGGGF